jgi:hypothetical protein
MPRLFLLSAVMLMAISTSGKDKQSVTIQVVASTPSVREFRYTSPATASKSTTDCNTTGTIGDGSINANTDCTTTTMPGKPTETHVTHIPQEHVSAIMPNGDHVILWCQVSWRRCVSLQPGSYEAEVKGNAVWMYTHELSGNVRKVKYQAVGGW